MSNDFIPFAVGGSANVTPQATYAADTTLTQGGFQSGIAKSPDLNKVWRQSSIMAAVLAQFIVDQSGQNAVDDGTTSTLEANLLAAVKNAVKQTVILTDTGAANAYAAANTPALTVLPTTGYVQRVNIAHANTGASTYAPDALTAKPIYGMGLQPLQGGELPVGVVVLMYLVQASVNSGNGAWIIIESLGGAQQIAPATASQHAARLDQIGHGQCRLSATSATQLTLNQYNGNNLIINGVPQQIPSAGVALANTGLLATTAYYIYAYMASGVMTLEASTTGHSTNTNGVEIKTGAATRTLVGLAYTNGSSQFTDSTTTRYVLNWFNRRTLPLALSGSVGAFTNTVSVVEVDTSKRLFFINWADEGVTLNLSGQCVNASSGFDVIVTGGLDNGTVVTNQSGGTIVTGGYSMAFACATVISATEGIPHILQLLARVGGGSGTLVGLGMSVSMRG